MDKIEQAFQLIREERKRQTEKYGYAYHHPDTWIRIVVEELGEIAQLIDDDDYPSMINEVTQVAAVATAWLETLLDIQEANI